MSFAEVIRCEKDTKIKKMTQKETLFHSERWSMPPPLGVEPKLFLMSPVEQETSHPHSRGIQPAAIAASFPSSRTGGQEGDSEEAEGEREGG